MAEPMTATAIATAIATIFLTKALEKAGEKFGEGTIAKVGQAIAKVREQSPDTARALEAADAKALSLVAPVLEPDPIFAELLAAAEAEENREFQQKLEEIKKIVGQNPNKLAEKIGIVVQAGGKVEIQEFKM